ncbi:MAG: ABC transporter ATP-binding protein [Bosea sp. (in: a-proteobacteria)]
MNAPQPVLEIAGLSISLPGGGDRRHAVDDVSFSVAPGEIVCVVGESGSGKSVTAFSVMGLLAKVLKPVAGAIRLEGEDLLSATPQRLRALRGDRMAMIFQEPMTALNPVLTIGDQIEEVLRIHTELGQDERRARVLEMMAAMKLPDPERIHASYPHQISGGQRQRVMIAAALVLDPALLIADEPTTALDVTTQAQILRLIKELQSRRGTGVLFITHDFGVVAEIADRVAVMSQGRVVETGTAAQVLDNPQHAYTRQLIAAVPALKAPPPRALSAEPIMTIDHVSKTYRTGGFLGRGQRVTHAVRDVSLVLPRGATLGIVGESGSGKSTLARCLVRLIDPDSGEIRLNGRDLASLTRAEMRAETRHIQMVFQDPFASLNPRRKAGELVAQGLIVHGMARSQAMARARELFSLVGLDPAATDRYPHEFSGGQRQRIGLARALALEPDVLVADEPVSALDVSVQAQVLRLLAELRQRLGISIVFITHDLRVAAQVCDLVAVMKNGEVVEAGPVGAVFERPQHAYTQVLLASIPGRAFGLKRDRVAAPETI